VILFQPDLLSLLTFIVSILLPLLVGIVTTRVTSSGIRAILLAALSLVTSVVTEWIAAVQNDHPFNLYAALVTWGGVFVIAVATHFGVWKPTGVSATLIDKVGATAKHSA